MQKFHQFASALVIGILAAAAPASANVIYNWVPLTETGQHSGGPGLVSLGSLSFADSVVANGGFSFVGTCDPSLPINCAAGYLSGNFGNFSIPVSNVPGGGPPILLIDFGITFNADGTLSGTTNYLDINADYFLGGAGSSWSGVFNSDFLNCFNPNPCLATGYWQGPAIAAVPEPSTWAMMLVGTGLAGAIAMRRRKKKSA